MVAFRLPSLLVLAALGAVAATPASVAAQTCRPQDRLDLVVLVDNSTSVLRNDPGFAREFGSWLGDVYGMLRPDDQMRVFGILRGADVDIEPTEGVTVREPGTRAYSNGRATLQRRAGALLAQSRRPEQSDLAESLDELRGQLGSGACDPVVLLLTDGVLDPFKPLTRQDAVDEFESAAARIRRLGSQLIVAQVGAAGSAFDPIHPWGEDSNGDLAGLSARNLLRRVNGGRDPLNWKSRDGLLLKLFASQEWHESRGVRPVRSQPVTVLASSGADYLQFEGADAKGNDPAADSLLACNHVYDQHFGTQHHVSNAEGRCIHHYSGPDLRRLVRALRNAGLHNFAWATSAPKLFTHAIPHMLRSFEQIVVATDANTDCTRDAVSARRTDEKFPRTRDPGRLVTVAVSAPQERGFAPITLTLYPIPWYPHCFAPDATPRGLAPEAYNARSLYLEFALRSRDSSDPLAMVPMTVEADLQRYEWHRLRRIQQMPTIPGFPERWLVEGRISLPDSLDGPTVKMASAETPLREHPERECGTPVPGYLCYGFREVLSREPPERGSIGLDVGKPDLEHPFVAPQSGLESYGFLVPWPAVAVILLLAPLAWLAVVGLSVRRGCRSSGSGWETMLREVLERERTLLLFIWMMVGAFLTVLLLDAVLWLRVDPRPLDWRDVVASMWAFLACTMVEILWERCCCKLLPERAPHIITPVLSVFVAIVLFGALAAWGIPAPVALIAGGSGGLTWLAGARRAKHHAEGSPLPAVVPLRETPFVPVGRIPDPPVPRARPKRSRSREPVTIKVPLDRPPRGGGTAGAPAAPVRPPEPPPDGRGAAPASAPPAEEIFETVSADAETVPSTAGFSATAEPEASAAIVVVPPPAAPPPEAPPSGEHKAPPGKIAFRAEVVRGEHGDDDAGPPSAP